MKAMEAIRLMLDASGRSANSVSLSLGKHRNYLATATYKESSPRADNLAAIAEECGFELVLKGHGEEIRIDPAE